MEGDDQASNLVCLLSRCPSLTHLDLKSPAINQEGLDVLLVYGTSITCLTVSTITPSEDRSSAPCSWRELSMYAGGLMSALDLVAAAYLPLHSVEQLDISSTSWGELEASNREYWNLHHYPEDTDCVALVQQAASNLAGCPGFRRSPPDTLTLDGMQNRGQGLQLLKALAPFRSLGIKRFHTDMEHLGAREVKALADSLGGGLAELELPCAEVPACFWPALLEHFPDLSSLELGGNATETHIADVAIYCKSVQRPLALRLRWQLPATVYAQMGRELQATLRRWGVQHVTIQD
jgi:hypothetical protein